MKIAAGVAPLALTCPAEQTAGCRGTAELDPVRKGKARASRRGRTGSFGRGSFVIAAGKQAKVKIKLTAKAGRALGLPSGRRARAARRGRKIKVVVTVRQRGERAQRSVVTLRG